MKLLSEGSDISEDYSSTPHGDGWGHGDGAPFGSNLNYEWGQLGYSSGDGMSFDLHEGYRLERTRTGSR